MPFQQRLPYVNGDDGQWGDILVQWLTKEHYDDGTDNPVNGGHQKVTLRAGTATAGTAPLKFTSGTLLTSAEAGAMEFLSDKIYFTVTTGPTRKTIAIYDDSSGATGDIYYRDSSGNFTKLGIGSSGDVLKVVSGLPAWQASTAGDVSSNTGTSVDSEVALFSGTGGKTIKRASGSGIAKLTSGVLGTATSGTDYAPATSGTSILKGSGTGGFSNAVANTDYAPVSSPTFSGTVTLPEGQLLKTADAGTSPVKITNSSANYGKIEFNTSFYLATLQTLYIYAGNSDTTPVIGLYGNGNGTAAIYWGPGGSTAVDVSIQRSGTAAATVTGTFTFSSAPVISSIKNTGTLTLPTSTDTLVGKATTDTLTNKRVTKRSSTTAGPGATPTINTDNVSYVSFTALAANITSMTTNLSGTPNRGDTLWIDFTDNGTARTITWGSSFESSTVALPSTTVISTRLDVGLIWNTVTSKWRCVAVA